MLQHFTSRLIIWLGYGHRLPMTSTPSQKKALEEIHLLKCSLLPGELLEFSDQAALWNNLLDAYALDADCPTFDSDVSSDIPPGPACFQVKLETNADVWFDVAYGAGSGELPRVSVKGNALGREEQGRWQGRVAEAGAASTDSECVLH